MQKGKAPYNVLKRSVLKHVVSGRREVLLEAGIGRSGSVLSCKEDGVFVMSSNPVVISGADALYYGIFRCINHLAASGAEPVGISDQILLPLSSQEGQLADIMKQLNRVCADLGIAILGGHTAVSEAVNLPVITLTAVGYGKKIPVKPEPGWDLVLTKYVGMEGTALLAWEKEELLHSHYTYDFLSGAKRMKAFLSVAAEAAVGASFGAAMYSLSEGGVLAALWDMMDGAGLGMDVNLKAIPIRQETVEITEFFELNPYQMLSGGSLLMAVSNGELLVRQLEQQKIPAAVIGKTTDRKARILRRDEEERYLDRPAMDELYRTGLLV